MHTQSSGCLQGLKYNREADSSALTRRSIVLGSMAALAWASSGMAAPRTGARSAQLEGITPPDSEAQRIADLVTANHILADQEVNDGFGHVSVRSLKNPNHYYLSRSRAPELVTAADLIEYDLDSNAVQKTSEKMYEERYIHGEIYKHRPDVNCVVHSHTSAVLPFGVTSKPLKPIMHMAAFLPTEVPVFEIRDVEGPDNYILVTNPRSGAALAAKLGGGPVVLMRGHGMTVVGPNVRQAVYRGIYTKKAAEIELEALSIGGDVRYLSEKEASNFAQRLARMGDEDFQPLRPWPIWEAHAKARLREMFGGSLK